jgi:hypothetical protein
MPASASLNVADAISRAQQFLFSRLDARGFWECELIVDSTVVCDYVLYYHWVGQPEKAQNDRCRAHILARQLPDGGWPQFPGGPAEIAATIKGYHALRLTGQRPRPPPRPGSRPRPRRHPQAPYLWQALPRHVRALSLAVLPAHPGGDDAPADLGPIPYL